MQSMNYAEFLEKKATRYDSLKEFIAMLSAAPGSLKTDLHGEELAAEIIKGALFLEKFIQHGEEAFQSPGQ